MKLYCQYSGISFETTYGNFLPEHTYVHPAFTVPVTTLLKQRGAWFAGRIEHELDRRLLFLALLHATDQVEFHHAAKPSDRTMQSNFPALFSHVDWICRLKVPGLILPKFRITKETEDLSNVKYWMECWQQERERFEDGYRDWEKDKKNLERERILERNIKNPTKRAEQYAGLLASWALSASDAPQSKQAYWRELFLLKAPALYSANPDHIQELYDWLESELEAGSIYSHKALWYVGSILKRVKAGWSAVLGFTDEEVSEERAQASVFAIDDDLQRANTLAIISRAPSIEPTRSLYPSESAFLKAKIAWDMKQKLAAETRAAEIHKLAVEATTQHAPITNILGDLDV